MGGNTINFAKHFRAVHAVEIDPRRCEFLRHNVERVLGPRHNVRCHCGDFTAELGRQLEQDIVFFDPPWGGLGYKKQAVVPLFLSGINLSKICCDLQGRAAYIVLKVPINFDFVNFTAETSRTLEQLFLQEMFAEYNQRRAKFTLVVLRFRAPPAAKRKQPSASAAVADAGGGGTKRPKPDDDPTAHNAERYDIKTKQARGGKTDREVLRERVSDPTYPLKRYHNTVKRELINRFALRAAHVLDIASGRGGDLSKWVDAGVLRVTGLDVAASEVAEATERYNGMVQKGTNWSEQRARHGGAAAAQALVAEYREYAKVGKEELPLKDGVFDAITIMFAFHYFFQNMKTLDQVLADVGRCLRPGGYFFGTMPDGQRVLELLDGRPEFTNSFLKLAQRWEGVRKPIGSLYAFGIKNTVTEDVGEAENLEYLAMLDSFLPAMAKRHGLHVVTELQAPGLEALLDEQDVASAAPFKHFAPSRAQPAWSRQGAGQPHIADVDLQKASWVNCCFVFQKR